MQDAVLIVVYTVQSYALECDCPVVYVNVCRSVPLLHSTFEVYTSCCNYPL